MYEAATFEGTGKNSALLSPDAERRNESESCPCSCYGNGADLILADEPTSALDVTVQAEVVKAMQNMKKVTNAAILMVTHNMGVVAQMADKVGVMQSGKLVEWGTAEEVLSHPVHDYTKMLMSCVLRMETEDE